MSQDFELYQYHFNLGNAYKSQGQLAEAAESYRQAVRINPDEPGAYNNLGAIYYDQKHLAEAAECYRAAARLNPHFAGTHYNLGNVLFEQRQFEEAGDCFRTALQLDPNHVDTHYNLGCTLHEQGLHAEAIACFQHALHLDAHHANSLNNLGCVYKDEGRYDEAMACYQDSLGADSRMKRARWNRAVLRLLLGDFAGGWPDYELRWEQPEKEPRHFSEPRWDGLPLEGKTILLYAEQGFGDTLHFIRYAALVKKMGGVVLFECQPALVPLLRLLSEVDIIVPRDEPLPPFDCQIPLASLPGLFHTTLANMPASVPYLRTDADLDEHWRRELQPLEGYKVGIVWQGSPTARHDRYRSCPLRQLEPLARIPGVQLVSLQKGDGAAQLAGFAEKYSVLDVSDRLHSFLDTAAVVKNLDLAVTVDTSVAHLAGALGVPVWIGLAYVPDWRWLLNRADSPWYPSARLFRQPQFGDWEAIFAEMANALDRIQATSR